MVIFNKIVPDTDLAKWFNTLWEMFREISNKNSLQEDIVFLIESLFINLNVIVQKMICSSINFEIDSKSQLVNEVFSAILTMFHKYGEPMIEPMLFLTSFIEKESDLAVEHMDTFLGDIINRIILIPPYPDLFKAAITCIGTLVKIFNIRLENFASNIIPSLINALENSETNKDIKITIFFTISDIAAHCPLIIFNYITNIIKIIKLAFDAVISLQNEMDPESIEYCGTLKDTLIELILCLVHGIYLDSRTYPHQQVLKDFLPDIIQFGEMTTNEHLKPQINYIRDFLMLLCDFTINNKQSDIHNEDLFKRLMAQLKPFKSNTEVAEVLDVARSITNQNQYRRNGYENREYPNAIQSSINR